MINKENLKKINKKILFYKKISVKDMMKIKDKLAEQGKDAEFYYDFELQKDEIFEFYKKNARFDIYNEQQAVNFFTADCVEQVEDIQVEIPAHQTKNGCPATLSITEVSNFKIRL